MPSSTAASRFNARCSIARSLSVLGERWTFLILREAFMGTTRFADFRDRLGVAADVLSDRLATLVAANVLTKQPYQEPGSRARFSYHLTADGEELRVVLGALQQWGDEHHAPRSGPSYLRRAADDGRPLHVAFVDDDGQAVPLENVAFVKA
jgi:DNA-binding HxlR family transcriptional regulator